jgi:hypothetical protein
MYSQISTSHDFFGLHFCFYDLHISILTDSKQKSAVTKLVNFVRGSMLNCLQCTELILAVLVRAWFLQQEGVQLYCVTNIIHNKTQHWLETNIFLAFL